MPKPLTVWIIRKWKILQEMGIPEHLTCLLRNLYAGQEATVRTDMEQQTGSKLWKEYVKDVHLTHSPTPKQKEMHMGELFQRNSLKYGNIPIMNIFIMVLIWSGKKLGKDKNTVIQNDYKMVAQKVKNLPAVQETRVRSLGQEDPSEKGMATQSSILAWRISWTEEPGGLPSVVSQRVGHGWATNTYTPQDDSEA